MSCGDPDCNAWDCEECQDYLRRHPDYLRRRVRREGMFTGIILLIIGFLGLIVLGAISAPQQHAAYDVELPQQ